VSLWRKVCEVEEDLLFGFRIEWSFPYSLRGLLPTPGQLAAVDQETGDKTRTKIRTPAMPRFSNSQLLVLAVLLLGIILSMADLLVVSVGVLLLIFAGLLFGVFLNGLSRWIARRTPLSYLISYLVVVTVIVLLIGFSMIYLGAQVAQRSDKLWSELQTAVQQTSERLRQYDLAEQYLPDSSQVQDMLTQQGSTMLPKMLSGLQSIGWAMTGAFVIFFVGMYGAYNPQLYHDGLLKLLPKERRQRGTEVLLQLRSALGLWIVGRLISMAIVGVLTAIGLWILGVPLPISLGVLAALLTFIPNIGPLLAAIPQVLLALNVGTNTALYVILFNIALQGIESYLITPMIQRHEVTLPPILTISAQLLMAVLVGVIGIMMAAPLVVVAMVLVQMLYVHDRLGDRHPGQLTSS